MKRRNFLSGLMAAPLALKARLVRFFARKPTGTKDAVPATELCGAPIFESVTPKVAEYYQPFPDIHLLAQGKSLKEACGPPIKMGIQAL